jgi:hypothetical protein
VDEFYGCLGNPSSIKNALRLSWMLLLHVDLTHVDETADLSTWPATVIHSPSCGASWVLLDLTTDALPYEKAEGFHQRRCIRQSSLDNRCSVDSRKSWPLRLSEKLATQVVKVNEYLRDEWETIFVLVDMFFELKSAFPSVRFEHLLFLEMQMRGAVDPVFILDEDVAKGMALKNPVIVVFMGSFCLVARTNET